VDVELCDPLAVGRLTIIGFDMNSPDCKDIVEL